VDAITLCVKEVVFYFCVYNLHALSDIARLHRMPNDSNMTGLEQQVILAAIYWCHYLAGRGFDYRYGTPTAVEESDNTMNE
jgi:hypothetical protein